MISGIDSLAGAFSPYSMYGGMYGMGMMGYGMGPQTLEQYRNMRTMTSDLQANQVSFMGRINPIFGLNQNNSRSEFLKSLGASRAEMSSVFSPYSSKNIGQTREMMSSMAQLQAQMMINPFSMMNGGIMC